MILTFCSPLFLDSHFYLQTIHPSIYSGVNSHYGLGAYGHSNSYGGGHGRYPHDPIGADVRATDFYPRPAVSDPLGVNMGLLNIA